MSITRPLVTVTLLLSWLASAGAQALPDPKSFPAYQQLRRDVLINADLWEQQPRILSAGYGFEGIQGIPTLLSAAELPLAVAAGAGVNLDWAALDPVPPLRNLTSGGSPIGIASAGFGAYVLLADAMPVVFSWPLLPSTVSPSAFAITLNTGEVVAPSAAALNPNYDHNERHVIVLFGEFGNRLTPDEPGAIYPVSLEVVTGDGPLMAVGPLGPVSLVGLSQVSSHPYVAGPSLVGARLSRFSPVGDFPVPALANAFPNDALSLYGNSAQFRLRLLTSGGFSPDGVSGLLPDDFDRFFRLHATDVRCRPVVIEQSGRVHDLGVGRIEVIGLAEVGAPVNGAPDRAYYVEDHDNYFDIILRGDTRAMARITAVEIPGSAVPGYFDIYNPGGPGRTPDPDTRYTRPALPQMQAVDIRLDQPLTVSHAEQDISRYDDDDDHAVVFRIRDPFGPDRFTSSTIVARSWIDEGLQPAGVDFPNEMARPGVSDVIAFVNEKTGDRIYTLDQAEQNRLSAAGSGWRNEGRAFGAFATPQPGAGPIHRFFDRRASRHLFTPDRADPGARGAQYQGVGWYGAILRPGLTEPGRQQVAGDGRRGRDCADRQVDGLAGPRG
jgi:hypothetical protein